MLRIHRSSNSSRGVSTNNIPLAISSSRSKKRGLRRRLFATTVHEKEEEEEEEEGEEEEEEEKGGERHNKPTSSNFFFWSKLVAVQLILQLTYIVGISLYQQASMPPLTILPPIHNTTTARMTTTTTTTTSWDVSYSNSNHITTTDNHEYGHGHDCVYVPGGGFSGFWFTLGRLQWLQQQSTPNTLMAKTTNHTYVCFSAGCLGVVATLQNFSLDDLYNTASTSQADFMAGKVHRYEVVESFVDRLLLLESNQDKENHNDENEWWYSQLRILTSVPESSSSVFRASMQTPTSRQHLKTLLLQTTWIPWAVGNDLTYQGHLDGGFSILQHPQATTCSKRIGLAWDSWDFVSNILNVRLSPEAVYRLWSLGMEYDE